MTDRTVSEPATKTSDAHRVERARAKRSSRDRPPLVAAILAQAQRSGLLEGGKSAHVSFRVPQALVEAAKRETGIDSTSELGTLALAMLAQPDPVATVMKRTRGRLGRDHTLDY